MKDVPTKHVKTSEWVSNHLLDLSLYKSKKNIGLTSIVFVLLLFDATTTHGQNKDPDSSGTIHFSFNGYLKEFEQHHLASKKYSFSLQQPYPQPIELQMAIPSFQCCCGNEEPTALEQCSWPNILWET